jgi:hypothetical protein
VYVGHLAVALAACRTRARVPLWLLLVASQGPDWINLFGAMLGISEKSTELISHSIPAVLFVALALSLSYGIAAGDIGGGLLLFAVYGSHLILDLATGSKILWPGGGLVGAALYERPGLDFLIEAGIAVIGWWIYRSVAHERRARASGWLILVTLIVCQATLDVAQEARLLRRNPGDANWPFGIGGP